MDTNPSFAKRHSLVLFFVLAYVFSWGNFIWSRSNPSIPFLFPFGPLVAAIIVAVASGGLKVFVSRCLRWRVGIKWYAAAFLVPAFIGLTTVAITSLAGGPAPSAVKLGPWYTLFIMFPMALIDAPLGEESGWRGFAMPRFPANRPPLLNTLILGVLIMGWHLPLVISEPALTAPYVIAGIASAILTNWVYYNARGSALLAMLYHSAANTFGIYFAPLYTGSDIVRYFWMLAVVNWAVAIGVILATRATLKHRSTLSAEMIEVESPVAVYDIP